jgi:hypothetical protein
MLAALLISGCSTTYKPLSVDSRTGLYDTSTVVAPGGVTTSANSVNLKDFGAVLLVADSNSYPSRLEFVARRALAELGIRRVVNIEEYRQWASDRQFVLPDDKLSNDSIKSFSSAVTPVLVIQVRYGWLGDTQHYGGLRVTDGRTGEALLTVSHPKGVWMNVDQEVIYPVLNELRKWHRATSTKSI